MRRATRVSTSKYWPRVTCVIKDLSAVGSRATDIGSSKIVARVKTIVAKAPTAHVNAEPHNRRRSFSACVESLPSVSSSRKAIARRVPIVAKLPTSDKYLTITPKALIGP